VANEEHVERLRQGVAEWNAWREEDVSLVPDLSDANLRGIDLHRANLFRADLRNANLSVTNLSGAKLSGSLLSGGDLSGANLTFADLTVADLIGANLSGANLSNTLLIRANLTSANLSKSNLTGTFLGDTVFADVDLSSVIGLEQSRHGGASILDHRTLQKSRRLPLTFLRGIGLPDQFIEYLPSLLGQAIQYYSCFISYSSGDQDFADRLYADLQNEGVRCWFAPHDLRIGEKILDGLDAAIRVHDKLLLILSKHSIKSDWVEGEVTRALEQERKRKQPVLFPVTLDNVVMKTREAWAAGLRDQRNIGDFRHWKDHDGYKRSFERVLRDLKMATDPRTTPLP
jgi:uncharacterized protein YjbI with pentapeptide repeats